MIGAGAVGAGAVAAGARAARLREAAARVRVEVPAAVRADGERVLRVGKD